MTKLKIISPIVAASTLIGGLSSLTSCSSTIKFDTIYSDLVSGGGIGVKELMNFSKKQECTFEIDLSKFQVWKPYDGYFFATLNILDTNNDIVSWQMTGLGVKIGNTELEPAFGNDDLWDKDAAYWAQYDYDDLCGQIAIHLNKTYDLNEKIYISFTFLSYLEDVRPILIISPS